MLFKALILFAAVSAIAAADNDDLAREVQRKIEEFKGLYPVLSEQCYHITEEAFDQMHHEIAQITDKLMGVDFSIEEVLRRFADLEAQARHLNVDISECLRLNDLEQSQPHALAEAVLALNQAYSEHSGGILTYLQEKLGELDHVRNEKIARYEETIRHCLENHVDDAQKTCLFEIETEVELETLLFETEGRVLGENLEEAVHGMEEKLPEVEREHVAAWERTVHEVEERVFNCANHIFNN